MCSLAGGAGAGTCGNVQQTLRQTLSCCIAVEELFAFQVTPVADAGSACLKTVSGDRLRGVHDA